MGKPKTDRTSQVIDYSTPHFKAQAEYINKHSPEVMDEAIVKTLGSKSMLRVEAGGRGSRGGRLLSVPMIP